jgi:hypothetical protein
MSKTSQMNQITFLPSAKINLHEVVTNDVDQFQKICQEQPDLVPQFVQDLRKNSLKLLFLRALRVLCGSFFRYWCVSPVVEFADSQVSYMVGFWWLSLDEGQKKAALEKHPVFAEKYSFQVCMNYASICKRILTSYRYEVIQKLNITIVKQIVNATSDPKELEDLFNVAFYGLTVSSMKTFIKEWKQNKSIGQAIIKALPESKVIQGNRGDKKRFEELIFLLKPKAEKETQALKQTAKRKKPPVVGRPVKTSSGVTYNEKHFSKVMNSPNHKKIRGVLLYTDEDNDLKEYIQTYYQNFHKLSGDWCKIYILEKPCKKWRAENLLSDESSQLDFLDEIDEIDKSEAYKIAQSLKIPKNHMPCLVLFGENFNLQRLIFPIESENSKNITKYFRELFTRIESILDDVQQQKPSTSFYEIISNHFDDILIHLKKYAQPIQSQIQFLYQGQTIIAQNFVAEKFGNENYYTEGDTIMPQGSKKQTNNDLRNAQFAGGLVNADTVTAHQIGGDITNYNQVARTEDNNSPVKTILILAANPKNTSPLRLGEEVREIDAGLQRAKKRELFDLKQRWAVRVQEVYESLLDFKPQIVHFSGHGSGDDGLALEDETGNVRLVDTVALAKLFELFASNVECVVLNACYSEVQAQAIVKHIPYVIGMNKEIGDKAAIKFATGFYNALGAGESVEFAYKLGCSVIQLEGIAEDLTPVLKKK